jgi:isopentenyl-diphosphate delta-isomerase
MAEATRSEQVILVNERDQQVGTEDKLLAHRLKLRHRAFSVFVVNHDGKVLLQQRATGKYHSAGLWSNTACGHPRPGELVGAAARRRLLEEMGVDCPITAVATFTYCLAVSDELTENEFDHVFVGRWEGIPRPDPSEVEDWAWQTPQWLDRELAIRPERFTAWLPLAWLEVRDELPV